MKDLTKEKSCTFYVSDYHFEMISLPYISKYMDENKEVIILTENDLKDTVTTLLSKTNLAEDKIKKILALDWRDNNLSKFKEISRNSKNGSNMVIFIKGKENYIENVNKNIEKWVMEKENISVIDCYSFFEIEEKIDEVAKKYKKVLGTTRL